MNPQEANRELSAHTLDELIEKARELTLESYRMAKSGEGDSIDVRAITKAVTIMHAKASVEAMVSPGLAFTAYALLQGSIYHKYDHEGGREVMRKAVEQLMELIRSVDAGEGIPSTNTTLRH